MSLLTTVSANIHSTTKIYLFYSFIWLVIEESTPLVISRTLLQGFAISLRDLPPDVQKTVGHYTLEKIQPRVVAFEEQVSIIRIQVAKIYEREENWREAAKILVAIPLDSGQRYC